jgi:hypothetical protein
LYQKKGNSRVHTDGNHTKSRDMSVITKEEDVALAKVRAEEQMHAEVSAPATGGMSAQVVKVLVRKLKKKMPGATPAELLSALNDVKAGVAELQQMDQAGDRVIARCTRNQDENR